MTAAMFDRPRVLLVVPPLTADELFSRGAKTSASLIPPLGLASIAAFLLTRDIDCDIYDGIAEPEPMARVIRRAMAYDVVGITVISTYAVRAMELIRALASRRDRPAIVVGGPHVTALPETMLAVGADLAVIGEGELTMRELVECLATRPTADALGQIPGLAFFAQGKLVRTARRPLVDPLDNLPMPARDRLPMHRYRSSIARAANQPSHSLLTSRGCPGHCTFCSRKTFGTRVRYYSVERIVEEFFVLRDRYKARDVAVWDDNFLSDKNTVTEVCTALVRRRFGLPWSVEARIDNVDEDLLRALKHAGCAYIAYGIESGSQPVLDRINKHLTLGQIRETVRLTQKIGIPIRGYFMMGLPGENESDMEATIRLALELNIEVASFTLFVPLPGTVDFARARRSGRFDPQYWTKRIVPEFNFLDHPVYTPAGMHPKRLMALQRQAYNRYYLRPRIVARKLRTLRSWQDLKSAVMGVHTLLANLVARP